MSKEVQTAVYELAVLIAKKQPRGYVSEDVYDYQRRITGAISPACGYCPNCNTAACPNFRAHPLD